MKVIKNQKKLVNNQIYNDAYENLDNQKIISAVLSKYRGRLDEDTLKHCGLNALWRCLQNHNENLGTKFTSSLWRFVHWECRKELQTLARSKYKPVELVEIPINYESINIFDDLPNFLDQEHCKIVELRFIHGMTLKEIGKEFGYTKEAARQKLNYALDRIKDMVYNTLQG